MTDHDQQLRRVAHANYDAAKSPTGDGEVVGSCASDGIAAAPHLFGLADSQLCLSGQYLSGYSDDTIW